MIPSISRVIKLLTPPRRRGNQRPLVPAQHQLSMPFSYLEPLNLYFSK